MARPAGVRGPVELRAFCRLVASWRSDVMDPPEQSEGDALEMNTRERGCWHSSWGGHSLMTLARSQAGASSFSEMSGPWGSIRKPRPLLRVAGVAVEVRLPRGLSAARCLLQEVANLVVPAVLLDGAARLSVLDRMVALLDIHAAIRLLDRKG